MRTPSGKLLNSSLVSGCPWIYKISACGDYRITGLHDARGICHFKIKLMVDNAPKLPNILVTGTPGVGKTTLCSLLEAQLPEDFSLEGFQYVKLAELINTKKLYKDWNEEFDVPEYDEDMVCDELEPLMSQRGGIILEFHSCDFFPERWFDMIVLLRANNTSLFDRLSERGYKQNKIDENIECEIFEVLKDEVYECYSHGKIVELQSNSVEDMQANLGAVAAKLQAMCQA